LTFAVSYLIMGLMCFLSAAMAAKDGNGEAAEQALQLLSRVYTTQNLLISFGIISVCSRLDRLLKKKVGGGDPADVHT
jgi:hypothetical protein